MEGLESEVLEFLATLADFVDAPVPRTSLSLPSSNRTVMTQRNDRVYRAPLRLGTDQLKRKRANLGGHSQALETEKVVLFPAREQFKGVQRDASYVSLLQGHSKWKKPERDTKTMECSCSSMVSCSHNS